MNTKVTIVNDRKISIGDWFLYNGELFHLAQVDSGEVCLISTKSGNRQREALEVNKVSDISAAEFQTITDGDAMMRVNVEILVLIP